MSFTNRISQTLHDEHGATVALMERLEQLLARGRRGGPPDKADASVARLLSDLSTGVEAEIERHFAFEENHLFTFLEAIGDAGIGAHLLSELYNNNDDRLSTAFEFGSKLGIGYIFSPRASVGLSIQHYSNGGIKHPNSGVDFVSMKVSYFFP